MSAADEESLEMCEPDRLRRRQGVAATLIAQARRWSGDDDPEIRDLLLRGAAALHRDR